jgi:demethylspheroidene O-methyltransferase
MTRGYKKLSIRLDSQEPDGTTMGSWRERWIAWRNRRLADPAFQAWAARFPATRWIVRRDATRLFDRVAGFVYSQTILACVETDLLETLRTGPAAVEDFARSAGLPDKGALRLLKAASSLGLAEPVSGGRFALGAQGAALLGNPGIAAMVRHHRLLYRDLADPVSVLRSGRGDLARYWDYDSPDAEASAAYSQLMGVSQPLVAAQIVGAYDFGRHTHLLDVGGGEGVFVRAVGVRWPKLRLSLFDLPHVADRTRALLDASVTVTGGSFADDPLPKGADIISLVRILHDHDDEKAAALLRSVCNALPDGGALVVAEPMAETRGAEAMGEAYFGFYLAAMGSGRPRTPAEIGEMTLRAGFARWRVVPTDLPLIALMIVATKA